MKATYIVFHFILQIGIAAVVGVQSSDADGGVVQMRREAGPFLITVFTSPTPVRTGPVDVSVMIQDRANQEPVLDAQVIIQLQRQGSPAVSKEATRSQSSNKLLYAALLNVPLKGLWNLQVVVRHGAYSVDISNPLTVEQARSPLLSYWFYLTLPFLIITLFLIHQRLKGIKSNTSWRNLLASPKNTN